MKDRPAAMANHGLHAIKSNREQMVDISRNEGGNRAANRVACNLFTAISMPAAQLDGIPRHLAQLEHLVCQGRFFIIGALQEMVIPIQVFEAKNWIIDFLDGLQRWWQFQIRASLDGRLLEMLLGSHQAITFSLK